MSRRYEQIRRLFYLAECLRGLRFGSSTREIHRDLAERFGEVSQRTVRRDLILLEELGLVEMADSGADVLKYPYVSKREGKKIMQEGKWYHIVLDFGWVFVGRFAGREGMLFWKFSDAGYIRRAGTTHAQASQKGLQAGAERLQCGIDNSVTINCQHVLWLTETQEPHDAK